LGIPGGRKSVSVVGKENSWGGKPVLLGEEAKGEMVANKKIRCGLFGLGENLKARNAKKKIKKKVGTGGKGKKATKEKNIA